MTMKDNYIPQKQDIIWIDFDPSLGKEIQKRRPALVVSSHKYSQMTGFVAVCPITHGAKALESRGLSVPIHSDKVDGAVNPMQLYTFDFRARNASKITQLDTWTFQKVVQLYNYIFD
ncbi:TPA: type II toxin-antitoxin system PemK/MazF family toxin [Streptococcus suis]|nr:type II toxin-antitoxin system PemK/MazF family toxin [Streptococcus suis]HEM3193885.1 type II toxin-antitoxin system PemK/MazF family toxin [Streptococcus suis 10581]MBY4975228.1 type II toxin-antitoxin system PemK/MazF family toxin [Streptococcus suis]MBY5023892.1 type II toxin-antitoxin system PemK/MazF family toxin [Streptococcus suis]MCB2913710.1 type II toxin-antitoxin system PemK/MazF family toxin [Streptococcus suis]MCB2919528.1 type II toxin-antitoxin system PemK/MazF family toxin 